MTVEYRVRSKNGLSGRASGMLSPFTGPHTMSQALAALEAERASIRNNGLFSDHAYKAQRIREVVLEQRIVTPWEPVDASTAAEKLDDIESAIRDRLIGLMVEQFNSDNEYTGAEVIGRLRSIQLALDGIDVRPREDPAEDTDQEDTDS